jgi:hypothetical protein
MTIKTLLSDTFVGIKTPEYHSGSHFKIEWFAFLTSLDIKSEKARRQSKEKRLAIE